MSNSPESPRLVLLDSVVVDVTFRIDALPERGSDTYVNESVALAGGGFNVMSAASRLGLSAVYGGVVGTGPFASIALRAMRDEGIVVALEPVVVQDTGYVIVMLEPDGERTFLSIGGAEATLTAAQLASVVIWPRDFVYFSGYSMLFESNRQALVERLPSLPDAVTLVFDPGPLVDRISETALRAIYERVDWFSCNAREAELLTGIADPTRSAEDLLLRLGRGGVVVRTGEEGCVVAPRGHGAQAVAGFPVSVVDSNGAGDCHVGAFMALLANGRCPVESAEMANAAAALSVTKRGPATGPTRAQLHEFLTLHQRA